MKRLSNAINWMLIFADKKRVYEKSTGKTFSFRLAFITLTLSAAQKHKDSFIKNHMLQPFLYWITRYHKANYVWKAETQLNGNIHFHITVDTFIHWKSIRKKWNEILAAHDYCKVFQDGTNDKGNSSTQVKCVLKELEVAKYLASYMAKKNEYRPKTHQTNLSKQAHARCNQFSTLIFDFRKPADNLRYLRIITGRLWGCSQSLSKVSCILSEEDGKELFFNEEHQFFKGNTGIQSLSKLLRERETKHQQSQGLEPDAYEIHKKFFHLENVYIHRNLLTMKKGPILQSRLAEEKKKRQSNTQTHFTVNSLQP